MRAGKLAKQAENRKTSERSAICRQERWTFVPFNAETVGMWSQKLMRLWALKISCSMSDAALARTILDKVVSASDCGGSRLPVLLVASFALMMSVSLLGARCLRFSCWSSCRLDCTALCFCVPFQRIVCWFHSAAFNFYFYLSCLNCENMSGRKQTPQKYAEASTRQTRLDWHNHVL